MYYRVFATKPCYNSVTSTDLSDHCEAQEEGDGTVDGGRHHAALGAVHQAREHVVQRREEPLHRYKLKHYDG